MLSTQDSQSEARESVSCRGINTVESVDVKAMSPSEDLPRRKRSDIRAVRAFSSSRGLGGCPREWSTLRGAMNNRLLPSYVNVIIVGSSREQLYLFFTEYLLAMSFRVNTGDDGRGAQACGVLPVPPEQDEMRMAVR